MNSVFTSYSVSSPSFIWFLQSLTMLQQDEAGDERTLDVVFKSDEDYTLWTTTLPFAIAKAKEYALNKSDPSTISLP